MIDFDVIFDKNEEIMRKLVDSAQRAKVYFSDTNPSYQNVLYPGTHFYFKDKSHTFTVESINSDVSKYFAALQRKSKCVYLSLNNI